MIRGRKLVLRIYLIGLAQIAALAVTFALAREAREPPVGPRGQETRFLIDEISAGAADHTALEVRLHELRPYSAWVRTGGAVDGDRGRVQTYVCGAAWH